MSSSLIVISSSTAGRQRRFNYLHLAALFISLFRIQSQLIPGDISIDMKVRPSFESKVPPAPSLFVVEIYFPPKITEARWRRSIYFVRGFHWLLTWNAVVSPPFLPAGQWRTCGWKKENPLIRQEETWTSLFNEKQLPCFSFIFTCSNTIR